MAADWPADEVDANDGVAPSSDRRGIKTLQTARLHVILDNAHAGPATRIQSDHRGCWTGALTPAAGLALALHPGRFVSRLGLSAVLDGLETVALSAVENDRDQALTISKAVWDRARLAQERLDLPTADAICKRVRLSWRRALALALAEASRRTTLLGQWDSSHAAEWGDDGPELAVRALKAVTARIGRIPAAFEYDYEVRAIEMEPAAQGLEASAAPPQQLRAVHVWDVEHGSGGQRHRVAACWAKTSSDTNFGGEPR
jgi:hypothetical protein